MKGAITRVAFAVVLLFSGIANPLGRANPLERSVPSTGRDYTEESPLVYEDAWDLWPYVFLDDKGRPSGFNVDLIRMIMERLNIPYEIRLKPTQQALEDLHNGRSDLMLGMMADFHDDYTQHYSKNVIHIFTHSVAHPTEYLETEKGKDGNRLIVHSFDDLATHQVIVHTGSFSHHLMEERGWGHNVQPFEDMALAIQMVSTEKSGEVLWNTMSLKWLIHKYHATNLTLSPVDMPSGEYRFMSNDSVLLARLDDAYARLKAEERLQPIEMKWFYPEKASSSSSPAWLWYVAYAIGIVALLLTVATIVSHLRERRATAQGRLRINRLAVVLKTCKVSIWTYDVEKKLISWYGDDARTQRTLTPKEFVRRYWPGELKQLQDAVRRLIDKESESATLHMHITDMAMADNANHIYRVVLSVLKSNEGKPAIIIGTESDADEEIGKQRKTDEMMRRYRSVFSTAMIDMIYCDSEGYVLNMNKRAQLTFGLTLDDVRRRHLNINDFLPDDNKLQYSYATHAMTPEGSPLPPDQHPNATSRFYEMQIVPVFDHEENPIGLYATGREVTEVARTYVETSKGLKQLRAAKDELGEYVDNINFVLQVGGVRIVTYSPDTHVLTIFHRMHEAQYVLTQQRCLSLTAPESLQQVMRIMRAMDRRTTATVNGDIRTRLHNTNGQPVCLQIQLFPDFDTEGNMTGYEGICRDVSEIKHTEEQLKLETGKAQEVEQLKIRFLHNMCSAIRTPLDAVVKSAEMFKKEHNPAEEAAYIATIKESSAYLLNLVNDILFLSRLDAHMVESKRQETDFAKVIEDICHNAWTEGRKDGVIYEVVNVYERLVLNIDLNNLIRILEQLLRNAVQHTEHGRVRLRYEYIGGRLVLGIDDTGDGIPKKVLNHVFDRFNTPTGRSMSTGLGLPICKELVTLMGGQIEITTEEGKGTTVWVTIPCKAKGVVRK